MTVCAIHQPNFFPWLGYFHKISKADVFVILDGVDYPTSGSGGMGSRVNRVQIAINGKAHWFGAPVKKSTGGFLIKDVEIAQQPNWRKKSIKTLANSYARAVNYKNAMELLEPLILNPTHNLSAFNITAIKAIAKALGIETQMVIHSELGTKNSSTMRLIEICQRLGADTYYSGQGASGYQEENLYLEHGIHLQFQDFEQFNYRGNDSFILGLSVIDYLMHTTEWDAFATRYP